MAGSVSGKIVVNAPATSVWDVYKTLELADIIEKGLPDIIEKIEAVGDGSVGTVLKMKFKPGAVPFSYYNEKFIKVDHEKRVKETEIYEGGYRDMGFSKYVIRFEIIEKDEKSCITKATIEYQLHQDADPNLASSVSIDPIVGIMNLAAAKVLDITN